MTPAARTQAAIEVVAAIESGRRPADRELARYLRGRRYIGGGDRRAITELVYDVLRRRGSLAWRLAEAGAAADGRRLVAIALAGRGEDLDRHFDGSRYGPQPLEADERDRLAAAAAADPAAMPTAARLNYPEWLEPALKARFGGEFETAMTALDRPAALDLRVNSLKADRETVRAMLAADGFDAEPTPLSPVGLRVAERTPITGHRAFRDGLVEIQDEGAQIAAFLTAAAPGQLVVDYCAGGGGKTLALAAAMADRGRLIACDSDPERLARIAPRLARAGVASVETRPLAGDDDAQFVDEFRDRADRVLADMPCSGSGTWRRNPDAKWRLTPEALAGYVAQQDQILDRAHRLVKPGGRLVYATCSLLAEENEAPVERFLAAHAEFRTLAVPEVWAAVLPGPCPAGDRFLQLSPHRHGVDAFFVAILERAPL